MPSTNSLKDPHYHEPKTAGCNSPAPTRHNNESPLKALFETSSISDRAVLDRRNASREPGSKCLGKRLGPSKADKCDAHDSPPPQKFGFAITRPTELYRLKSFGLPSARLILSSLNPRRDEKHPAALACVTSEKTQRSWLERGKWLSHARATNQAEVNNLKEIVDLQVPGPT